jgi:hypothetical protein
LLSPEQESHLGSIDLTERITEIPDRGASRDMFDELSVVVDFYSFFGSLPGDQLAPTMASSLVDTGADPLPRNYEAIR